MGNAGDFMNRPALLAAAYALDHILGDPESLPHPVRLIGAGIKHGELLLRSPAQTPASEFIAGAILTTAIVAASYAIPAQAIRSAYRYSHTLGIATELLLASTCIAARNLQQEATAVVDALDSHDLPLARTRLARIVGRDTDNLDASEIARAVIETLAESACDGTIAPLFYLAFGGVPLAMAYKAINTLDSMIGHADERYLYFGKAAARLDDAANFLPARITALALCTASIAAASADPSSAWHTWQRDGRMHKSPNAGQPESAIAGALHVQLGGPNTYTGELIAAPRIGSEFARATPTKARHAIRLVTVASLFGLAAAVMLTASIGGRRR
jgi:adenosylcobinamide-phosphate synthase